MYHLFWVEAFHTRTSLKLESPPAQLGPCKDGHCLLAAQCQLSTADNDRQNSSIDPSSSGMCTLARAPLRRLPAAPNQAEALRCEAATDLCQAAQVLKNGHDPYQQKKQEFKHHLGSSVISYKSKPCRCSIYTPSQLSFDTKF